MPTAKKTKLESAKSFQPPCDTSSEDDDDDLFISVWDGQSSKMSIPKPEKLRNITSTASESGTNNHNTGTSHNNGLDTCTVANELDKPSFSGLNSSEPQNKNSRKGNYLHDTAKSKDQPATSAVDSSTNDKNPYKDDLESSTNDWNKPSCSGVSTRNLKSVDLSLETDDNNDICRLQTMFPSLDKDVLKTYMEIYQDIEECVRVVTTQMCGFVYDNDVCIRDDIDNYDTYENSLERTVGNEEQAINHSKKIHTHEPKSMSNDISDSSAKGEKKLRCNDGRSDRVVVKSERNLDSHDPLESKAPLNSNSGDISSNNALHSSHSTRESKKSVDKNKVPCSNEMSSSVTFVGIGNAESKSPKLDVKVCQRDTKARANQPLPSTDAIQVGIDIRFGNNRVHRSMKRCVDRSAASRDIAKPYRGNTTDMKSSRNSRDSRKKTSDVKHKSGHPITNSSPSKRKCFASLLQEATRSQTPSRNSAGFSVTNASSSSLSNKNGHRSTPVSLRNSDVTSNLNTSNSVINSSLFKNTHGQRCSSTPGSSHNNTRSDDFRSTPTTSRNISGESVTNSSSYGQSCNSTLESSNINTSSDAFRSTPTTSRNSSDDNTRDKSTPNSLSHADFISAINSFQTKLLELERNHVSYNSSKKGKSPKFPTSPAFPPLVASNQDLVIDLGDINQDLDKNQSSATKQPQTTAPDITGGGQPADSSKERTRNNNNQNRSTSISQEQPTNITNQNQDSSAASDTLNGYTTSDPIPAQFVLLVKRDKPDTNTDSSEPQNQSQLLPHQEVSAEEEVAREEMLALQRDTEMLTKVCPENDPNYIFSRLEKLKDQPNRVAIVNKELIENASTSGIKNVTKKQNKVVWFWEDKNMRLVPFNTVESNTIESNYTKRDGSIVSVQFSPLTLVLRFDFRSMTVQETLRGKIRHVHRTESLEDILPGKEDKKEETEPSLSPLSNPDIWHGHDNSSNTSSTMTQELLEVLPGISEFAHVDSLLKKSLPGAIIKNIKRVKNDWLERKYGIQRGLLREKNGPGGINEKELFHGTRRTPPLTIWKSEDGFDMRFSADGMWGRGCYFAVHAAYSHHQFTYQFVHKQKHYYQIFLAHVLTGESISTNPDRSIKKPPLNASTGRQYDSITGITKGHQIYVLYKNDASFPAYLITYTM